MMVVVEGCMYYFASRLLIGCHRVSGRSETGMWVVEKEGRSPLDRDT
jgi:hypothetical protein